MGMFQMLFFFKKQKNKKRDFNKMHVMCLWESVKY